MLVKFIVFFILANLQEFIKVLKKLRDLGNTVVVVEHDESMMRSADHIIDMGPLASHLGGEVVAEGNLGIDGADYQTWDADPSANAWAYNWAAGKLNLTIVSE